MTDGLERQYNSAQIALTRLHLPALLKVQADFNSGIAQLGLEQIQNPAMQAHAEGRRELRQRIAGSMDLLAWHKKMFHSTVAAFVAACVQATGILPEPQRSIELDAMQRSIQSKIAEQANFYLGREAWSGAANAWLDLLDAYPDLYSLRDGRLEYRDPLYDLVLPHIREINRIAVMEQEASASRFARLADNSHFLALTLQKPA